MVLLGVLLVLLAAAAGVVLVAGTAQLTDSVQIDVLGGTLSIPPLTLLVTGMVLISLFWLGWVILRAGLRRSRRHRAEAKQAAAAAEAKRAEQARETKRLQEEFAAREQALVEERRLREEAEARAGGSGDHTVDPVPTTRTTDAADADAGVHDRTVAMEDRAADASTTRGSAADHATVDHTTDAADGTVRRTDTTSQHGDRRV